MIRHSRGLSFLKRQAGLSRLSFLSSAVWGAVFRLIILLPFLLASCATSGNALHSESSVVIEGVPFYPQEAYQCGPASLAAVLNYRGVAVTPGDIASDIYSSGARGTLGIDMVLYAENKGLRAEQYSGGPGDLKRNIDSGNPVIILVDLGFLAYQKPHFMVLVGYNEEGFIVDSGKEHLKIISNDELNSIWKKTKFWTLVIGR